MFAFCGRFPIHGRSESDIRKMVYGGLDAECILSIQLPGDAHLMDVFIPRLLLRIQREEGIMSTNDEALVFTTMAL